MSFRYMTSKSFQELLFLLYQNFGSNKVRVTIILQVPSSWIRRRKSDSSLKMLKAREKTINSLCTATGKMHLVRNFRVTLSHECSSVRISITSVVITNLKLWVAACQSVLSVNFKQTFSKDFEVFTLKIWLQAS